MGPQTRNIRPWAESRISLHVLTGVRAEVAHACDFRGTNHQGNGEAPPVHTGSNPQTPMSAPSSSLPPFPLVGRSAELGRISSWLKQAEAGRGLTAFLVGESGVGKTRLARAVAAEAVRRGWSVASGRAYPVETGVPHAPFSDAMLPLLGKLNPETLVALTRGGDAELAYLFPAMRPAEPQARPPAADPAEFKTRLLWTFSQFLRRFSAKQPLLILLDDLHWADVSSLELLHFVARQISGDRIVLFCTYNEAYRDQHPSLPAIEQSLVSLDALEILRLEPLSLAATAEMVQRLFGVESSVTREFVALLHGWTRGNPFFLEETLKSLVQSGQLYRRDGTWLGWEVEELHLPTSVRDALLRRLARLTPAARSLADLHAVLGTSASYELLRSVSPLSEAELVTTLEELRRETILVERRIEDDLMYDFRHPLVRETLYGELGLARARMLHGALAQALEAFYGPAAEAHVDELAYHFARAGARHLANKEVSYLAGAGRQALARYAYREAADYLSAALQRADETGLGGSVEVEAELVPELARARQRLGEYDAAIALWERARADAERRRDLRGVAAIELRLGLAHDWNERNRQALAHYDAGLAAAHTAGDAVTQARLKLKKGECLQTLGRPAAARREIEEALALAETERERVLVARIHHALLQLYTWTGSPGMAREHGERALALANELGDGSLACTLHWGMAVLAGMTADGPAVAHHIAECERLAEDLRLPLHRLWIAEIAVEYASATGNWDTGIARGERAIALARSFNQRTLLPRLLVWTALIYLGRGDIERGRRYVDEAWELSGAGGPGDPLLDVHTVVPAHMGLAAYHLAIGDYEEAIRVGEAGVAIADRSGYTVWAIHRLLRVIAEASAWIIAADPSEENLVRLERISGRLRRDAEQLGHELGLAWADAADAVLVWLGGDPERAISMLRRAAERLEAIPFIPDATGLRRHLAIRLYDAGDRAGAIEELRRVHDIYTRLGAERELSTTREYLRYVGARPPAREAGAGAGQLTGREVEIVRLVAEHRSNKAIGRELDISARTVSTHLSNIFRKLGVRSRAELADLARKLDLADE